MSISVAVKHIQPDTSLHLTASRPPFGLKVQGRREYKERYVKLVDLKGGIQLTLDSLFSELEQYRTPTEMKAYFEEIYHLTHEDNELKALARLKKGRFLRRVLSSLFV